jgi:hypothetical protein
MKKMRFFPSQSENRNKFYVVTFLKILKDWNKKRRQVHPALEWRRVSYRTMTANDSTVEDAANNSASTSSTGSLPFPIANIT